MLTIDCSVYQEYLAKSLTDKYSGLSGQMDKVIHEANTEITSLRDQLSGEFLTSITKSDCADELQRCT